MWWFLQEGDTHCESWLIWRNTPTKAISAWRWLPDVRAYPWNIWNRFFRLWPETAWLKACREKAADTGWPPGRESIGWAISCGWLRGIWRRWHALAVRPRHVSGPGSVRHCLCGRNFTGWPMIILTVLRCWSWWRGRAAGRRGSDD